MSPIAVCSQLHVPTTESIYVRHTPAIVSQ